MTFAAHQHESRVGAGVAADDAGGVGDGQYGRGASMRTAEQAVELESRLETLVHKQSEGL